MNSDSTINNTVCVFCASSNHIPTVYRDTAAALGKAMASRGIALVYGGGNNGLMGVLAENVRSGDGTVIGVIPRSLKDRGYEYTDADEMIVTGDLRRRKEIMERRAAGFICLPGGFGTLEETLEIITLKQLRLLDKPIVLINTKGFFNGLLAQFEQMCSEHFFGPEYRTLFWVAETSEEALDYITGY
jgi:cytokinin riboside 5'-monophosphate phosphoribohydrolase